MKITINKRLLMLAVCCVYMLCFAFSTFADEQGAPVSGSMAVTGQAPGIGYTAKLYNADNGLPTSDANAVLSSSDGFIWIGSNSGLIKYDGTSFEREERSDDITGVNTLFEDSNHRLWVGTNDNGVVCLLGGQINHLTTGDGLGSLSVSAFAQDKSGNIFIGTKRGIYIADSDLNLRPLKDERLEYNYILQLANADNGDIYGCTNEGALFRIKDSKVTDFYEADSTDAGAVTAVCPSVDKTGEVWLGSGSGAVYRGSFDDGFKELQPFFVTYDEGLAMGQIEASGSLMLSSDPIISVKCAAGRVWIIINGMIFYINEKDDLVLLGQIPLYSGINDMTEDWEGNLWFTSSKQGVMKIVANRFYDIFANAHYTFKSSAINTVCLYDDVIFAGGDNGIDAFKKDYTYATSDIIGDVSGFIVSCMTEDDDGGVWIATSSYDSGLWYYSKDNKKINYIEENGMPSNVINCVTTAPDGAVLAGTDGGLVVFRDGKLERRITATTGLQNTIIQTAVADKQGIYYLGTDGDGIYMEKSGILTHLTREDGLTSDVITRMKYDEDRDIIWVITSNSIEYIKDGVIRHIAGFPYKDNYDIFFDKNGKAWVLSSNGIYVAGVDDMLNNDEFEYHFYGVADGLPSLPTEGSYSFLDDNGDLYIACRSGVSVVNIDSYFSPTQDIKFSVPYIDDGENRYYPDEDGNFTLPSSARNITIYSYALTYTMHDPLIQYYLDGADEKPVTLNKSDMTPVRYTNLGGGEYELRLSLIDGVTHKATQTVTLRITKKRTFYEYWWFYALCGVLVILIMVLIAKHYLNKKTSVYIERERQHKKHRLFFEQTATALVNAIDAKDPYTHGHSSRVAEYSKKLAEMSGKNDDECNEIYYVALLHDVGKIGIPGNIINKDSRLTDKEFEIIKQHPDVGAHILQGITEFPFLSLGARFHHERFDGRGYPNGLKGEEIPDIARIISVADAYDAMTSKRSYRDPIPQQKVREEFVKGMGTQFDPDYARLMLHLIDLDTEYEMKERDDMTELSGRNELVVDEHRSAVSLGIPLSDTLTTVRLEINGKGNAAPSVILFDSLDGQVHTTDDEIKDLNYYEYGEFFREGKSSFPNVRKTQSKTSAYKGDLLKKKNEYLIEAVKKKDHALIRLIGGGKQQEVIIALPDSSRFAYIGITGEQCSITNVRIEKAAKPVADDYIPRIAEEISYIDEPEGDMPNVQIDGYRTAASKSVALEEGVAHISFHTKSLPTARLVWHCPFINIFTSDDGIVGGKNYRDLALMRLDGECWECDAACSCDVSVSKDDSFGGWEEWKKLNKQGFDCTMTITREGGNITVATENAGIILKTTAKLTGINSTVYAAITGDQCAITNIRVNKE
ncbi:MAG: HD domain-containing protein [Ruminococcus sp.]|nr:HD domain-containing protein [Ruminococcus sp.]